MTQNQSNQGQQQTKTNLLPVSTSIRLSKWLADKFWLLSKVDNAKKRAVRRGDVYWCKFGENVGSEQCNERPAVVLQNNPANRTSPNTIVAPITNAPDSIQTVVPLNSRTVLQGNVLLGNIMTVSKARLGKRITTLDAKSEMPLIERAMFKSLGVIGKIEKLEFDLQDKKGYAERVKEDRNKAQDDLAEVRQVLGLPSDAEKETIITEITKLLKG